VRVTDTKPIGNSYEQALQGKRRQVGADLEEAEEGSYIVTSPLDPN